jgi:hypothetical protein
VYEVLARAQHAADRHWWTCMLECGKLVAQRKARFTTDDVVQLCYARYPSASIPERRAIGPVMRTLAALGYCKPTARWVKSCHRQCHRRPMMLWRSLLFKA